MENYSEKIMIVSQILFCLEKAHSFIYLPNNIHLAFKKLIYVFFLVCKGDSEWGIVWAGQTITLPCDGGYRGFKTRTCTSPPNWDDEDTSGCEELGNYVL